LPEHAVCPGWQVTDTDAPLEPVLWPAPDPVVLPNRPAQVVSVLSGFVATEPDWLWQEPPATVQEAWPVVARFTVVVSTGAGVVAVPPVGSAGFTEGVVAGVGSAGAVVAPDCAVAVPGFPVAAVGTVSVWMLFAPVSVVALPVHPVASVAHCTLAWARGPPVPAPVSAALASALVSAMLGRVPPAPVAGPLPVPVLLPGVFAPVLVPPVFAPYR
jgi:hypothetical protein